MVIPRGRCSSGTVRVSTSNSWWITAVKGRYQQHDNRRLLASFPRSLGGDDSVAASRSGGGASWEPLPSIQGVEDGNYQSPRTNLGQDSSQEETPRHFPHMLQPLLERLGLSVFFFACARRAFSRRLFINQLFQ